MPIAEDILARIRANDRSLTELNLSSQYPLLNSDDMLVLANALSGNAHLKLLIYVTML